MAGSYEFYVRMARTISHESAQWTSEIFFLQREHKIHNFELTCGVFDGFPKIFDHLQKISDNSLKLLGKSNERFRIFFENFQRLRKISKDFRRRPEGSSPGCGFEWIIRVVHFSLKYSCLDNKKRFNVDLSLLLFSFCYRFLSISWYTIPQAESVMCMCLESDQEPLMFM